MIVVVVAALSLMSKTAPLKCGIGTGPGVSGNGNKSGIIKMRIYNDVFPYSIDSPERSPRESLLDLDDTKAILTNRLPKAKEMMETQLVAVLEEYSETNKQYSDSNVNFGRHQILDFSRDLLEKSQQSINNLTRDCFILFSENVRVAVSQVGRRERKKEKVESFYLLLICCTCTL